MAEVRVQTEPIDVAAEFAAAQPDGAAGALVMFTGHVRAEHGSDTLVLEHYPGMTEKQLARIVRQAEHRFALAEIRVVHRVGAMAAGETIVAVCAVARHRHAAFDGARFIMDWLKTEAPFWKRTGSGNWVEARATDAEAKAAWD